MGRITGGFGTNDFIGCGQVGNMGSSVRGPWAIMGWLDISADSRTRNAAFGSFNHDSITPSNSQSMWAHLNCNYGGGSPATSVGSVMFNCGGATDTGFLQTGNSPTNYNDGNRHHFAWVVNGTNNAHSVTFYMDGVAQSITWNLLFTDNIDGTLQDWSRASIAGFTFAARQLTNGASQTDFTGGEWEDLRFYKRMPSADEMKAIATGGGCDSVSDYYFRLPLAGDSTYACATATTISFNGGSWASTYKNVGIRRRG